MATRLEPYRDYSEHEVINLFSLVVPDSASFNLTSWSAGAAAGGDNDAGVVVKAVDAELPGDLPSKAALKVTGKLRNYLGASGQPHVGFNAYPVVEMTMEPADEKPIGITLKQTLAYDENGENLLRYPLKKDELQAVLPGQAAPILVRGLVLLGGSAFDGGNPTPGQGLAIGDTAGTLKGDDAGTLGKCIATAPGGKFLCKVDFS
jgi:hypothetical protein